MKLLVLVNPAQLGEWPELLRRETVLTNGLHYELIVDKHGQKIMMRDFTTKDAELCDNAKEVK